MLNKITVLVVGSAMVLGLGAGVVAVANAQVATTTATTTSTVTPVVIPNPTPTALPAIGFIQFDGLVVQSVSADTLSAGGSAEVLAANPAFPISNSTTSMTMAAATCIGYATEDSTVGSPITCPTETAIPINSSSTSTGSSTMTYYNPYPIQVSATTQLLLQDRTMATLANITPGDTINVFGYYDADGNIQADVIRDLSKPVVSPLTTVIPTTAAGSTSTLDTTQLATIESIVTELQGIIANDSSTIASLSGTTTNSTLQTIITDVQSMLASIYQATGTASSATVTATSTTASSASAPMIPYVPPSTTATTTPY